MQPKHRLTRATLRQIWRKNYNVRLLFYRVLLLEGLQPMYAFIDPSHLFNEHSNLCYDTDFKNLYYTKLRKVVGALKRNSCSNLVNYRTVS